MSAKSLDRLRKVFRRPSRDTNDSPRFAPASRLAGAIALSITGVPFSVAHAQGWSTPTVEARAAALKPGQFVWHEGARPGGEIAIVISLPTQLAYVYRGGRLMGISTVSTGTSSKATPTGEFTILQKRVFHRSNLYSNAPMPFMQRLTWDGIAIHAGDLPGYPASHGCIRLPAAFAKRLYDMTEMGGVVRIVDTPVDDMLPRVRPKPLPPVLMVDRRVYAGDNVVASVDPAPRIALASKDVAFAAYDMAVADGYGAKGGRR